MCVQVGKTKRTFDKFYKRMRSNNNPQSASDQHNYFLIANVNINYSINVKKKISKKTGVKFTQFPLFIHDITQHALHNYL